MAQIGKLGVAMIDGTIDADGEGVAATHCVPGRYSSFSLPTLLWLELADGDAEAEGETFELLAQGPPSMRPLGRWNGSTLKLAWLNPLLMKSRRTELPTIVP